MRGGSGRRLCEKKTASSITIKSVQTIFMVPIHEENVGGRYAVSAERVSRLSGLPLLLVLVSITGCLRHPDRNYLKLRLTVTDMETVVDGLRRFAGDHEGLYPATPQLLSELPLSLNSAYESAQPISRIAPQLARYYVRLRVPTTDAWGHSFLYTVTADRLHYALIAVDADGRPSRRDASAVWPMSEPWRDIVLIDGHFVSYPYGVSVATHQ